MKEFPEAYLITFHTYGSWLHGVSKGSVDRQHNLYDTELAEPDKRRVTTMEARMAQERIKLNAAQRHSVEETIRQVVAYRKWELLAINVRTNHVHVVVTAAATSEKIMNDLKSWSTRRLCEAALIGADARVWSRHGSTRYLWNDRSVDNACRYVVEGQGVDLR